MSTSSDERAWSRARLAEEGVAYRVVNVLGSGFVNDRIDIQKLALLVRNADYAPRRFGHAFPSASRDGACLPKWQVVGATSVQDAHLAAEKLTSILRKVAFPSHSSQFLIRNIVGSTDVCFKVRLEGLARDHLRFSTYEPELFPGLIYRMLRPKCTLLIFISGKLVITGCQTRAEGEEALSTIYPVLLQYRLRDDLSEDDEDDDE